MSDYTIEQIMNHPAFAEAFYTELYGPAGTEGLAKEAFLGRAMRWAGEVLQKGGTKVSKLRPNWSKSNDRLEREAAATPPKARMPKAGVPKGDTPEARMMRGASAGKGSAAAGLPKAPSKTDAAGKPKNLFGLKDEYVTPALIGTGFAAGGLGVGAGAAFSS